MKPNARNTVHGHRKRRETSKTYNSWHAMLRRCYLKTHDHYQYYGAKGIKVCDAWKNSFLAFLGDLGERPDGMTLDRIDPNGGYTPMNCRWATASIQNQNKRKVEK